MGTVQHRKVRSFVRRPGRITKAQQRALEVLWPRWGLDFEERSVDLQAIFGRRAKRVLEIGFGDGEALLSSAANNSDVDYVGVEVHEPGIGHLLLLLERADIANVRIVRRDAVEVMTRMVSLASFDVVNLFFPDPWPKKRHHKRRLIQPSFLPLIERVLVSGGLVHVATDCADYAEQAAEVFGASEKFTARPDRADEVLAFRPPTKFERRGRRLGNRAVDLYYTRL